jgi:hypothetical protein
MRFLPLLAFSLLSACVSVPARQPVPAEALPFPVFRFFQGASEGRGELRILFRSARTIRVQSRGAPAQDGSLRLVQRIEEGDKTTRTREWRIREVAPSRYSGTLTDAIGPVRLDAEPGRLRIRYRMKEGLDAEQWLTLARDGRSAQNVMTVRKFGFTVAVVEETIRKAD